AARLRGARVTASADALGGSARALRRRNLAPQPIHLNGAPFGAFSASASLTADGKILAVPIPGHARGQIAVVAIEDDRHIFLGGDSAYSQQQVLDVQLDGVSTSARAARRTMRTILDHARRHPTVYLP